MTEVSSTQTCGTQSGVPNKRYRTVRTAVNANLDDGPNIASCDVKIGVCAAWGLRHRRLGGRRARRWVNAHPAVPLVNAAGHDPRRCVEGDVPPKHVRPAFLGRGGEIETGLAADGRA